KFEELRELCSHVTMSRVAKKKKSPFPKAAKKMARALKDKIEKTSIKVELLDEKEHFAFWYAHYFSVTVFNWDESKYDLVSAWIAAFERLSNEISNRRSFLSKLIGEKSTAEEFISSLDDVFNEVIDCAQTLKEQRLLSSELSGAPKQLTELY